MMTTTDTDEGALDLTAASMKDEAGLSPMERAFCIAALELIGDGEKHWRKQAAIRAGYAEPRSAAYRLVRRQPVIDFLHRHLTEAAETVKVDRSFVLSRALINLSLCEAQGDLRTARAYLDIIAKHTDVQAFTKDAFDGKNQAGMATLPFDLDKMTTDDKRQLLAILARSTGAAGEHNGPAAPVD